MRWFSVRGVYAHRDPDDGDTWFEERLVLFRADDEETLFALAEEESAGYLEVNPGTRRLGGLAAFALAGSVEDPSGAEVWSMVRQSEADPETFYTEHYASLETD